MKWWKRKKDRQQQKYEEEKRQTGFVSCLTKGLGKPVINPGQGWYSVFPFQIGETLDLGELVWCLDAEDRLVLLLLDISRCHGQELTGEMLEQIRQIFAFFVAHGREMVVRTVYDTEGKGLEKEPSFLDQVQRHMRQLGPVFEEFSEHICTLQGLFVGNWGEMHGSRHLSGDKIKKLAETLWEATKGTCYLAVRTPWQKRLLEETCVPAERVGIFNDGLFGSDTHLGTFGVLEDTKIRTQAWLPKLELSYLDQNTRHTSNGGETVWGGGFDSVQMIETLKKMHISYLNRTYDGRVMEHWKKQSCEEAGIQNGKMSGGEIWNGEIPDEEPAAAETLYEYIGRHLGYCFVVSRAWMEGRSLCIEGRNEGFGNLCEKAGVRLMAAFLPEEDAGSFRETAEALSKAETWEKVKGPEEKKWNMAAVELEEDPRQWECGGTFTLRASLPGEPAGETAQAEPAAQQGILLLFLELKTSSRKIIHFANESAGNRLFLGYLHRWKTGQ